MTWHTTQNSCMQVKVRQPSATKPNRMQLHVINMCRTTCAEEQVQQNNGTKHDTQHVQTTLSTRCNDNFARTRWPITCRSSMWRSSPLSEAHRHCMHKPAGLIPAGIVDMNTLILFHNAELKIHTISCTPKQGHVQM